MVYSKSLPKKSDLSKLAKSVQRYPAKPNQIYNIARTQGFPTEVISFIRLFPTDTIFIDQENLESRLSDLGIIIEQERVEPPNPMSLTTDQED